MNIKQVKTLGSILEETRALFTSFHDTVGKRYTPFIEATWRDFNNFFKANEFEVIADSSQYIATYKQANILLPILIVCSPPHELMASSKITEFKLTITLISSLSYDISIITDWRPTSGIIPSNEQDSIEAQIKKASDKLSNLKARLNNFSTENWYFIINEEMRTNPTDYQKHSSMNDLLTTLFNALN